MKTVRFVRDTDPRREGGPGYKEGQVHELDNARARRWVSRGAAEYVPEKASKGTKAASTEAAKQEATDDTALDSSATVDGADGSGDGGRTESAADTTGGGKGGGKGKGKSARGK